MAKKEKRFVRTSVESTGFEENSVWVDRETGVNYLWHSTGHAGGMTPPAGPGGEAHHYHPFGGEGVICMKLLFVNGCISQRGEESRTLVLARTFLDAWQARHPEAEVETVEPEALLALKPFAPEMLNDRDALAGIRCFDAPVYDLARQFRAADRVVVAAPFWDLTFPAALRTYIEYISANGLTITTRPTAARGLPGREAGLSHLRRGSGAAESLGVLYWKQLCAMFGIPAFSYVFAGGLDLDPAKTEEILTEACEKARRLAEDF